MNSFENAFFGEFLKFAEESAQAPAQNNSSKLKNILKVLAAGGLGYGAYKMYQGNQAEKARQMALAAELAAQSSRKKKALIGGALGAVGLGAAHHFGLDEGLIEKIKGSPVLEKVKGLFGGKAPVTGNEVFDQGGGEVSPHEDAQPTGVLEKLKGLFGKGSDPKQMLTGPTDQLFPEKAPYIPKERFLGIR